MLSKSARAIEDLELEVERLNQALNNLITVEFGLCQSELRILEEEGPWQRAHRERTCIKPC